MKCPIDGAILVISERSGIEIDYCPTCRGVWLDRGELDKIIERSAAPPPPPPPPSAPMRATDRPGGTPPGGSWDRPGGYDDRDHDHAPRRKKRGGFLEDLFDF